ncbi:GPR endopeptidase [Halalkalibacillus sediminis]|uniref:GPR endopeptidase n=1 Tax=Halalkalibacillus sediminis TaxID=2018042 RepID=UPI00192E51B5|nr:GPR endopeptidase [Halalkalibacillus sediminis]
MKKQEYSPRTDLAIEAKEMFVEENPDKKHELDGIIIKEYEEENIKLTRVEINEQGSERVGKNPGQYITIESLKLRELNQTFENQVASVLGKEIDRLLKYHEVNEGARCLVVGLGNSYVTPDALGPDTVKKAYITSHLFKYHEGVVGEGFRPVSAFNPGVMGLTGMETSNMINGIVKELNPDFLIVIDALAARSIDRVNTTIQLSDAGIHPGSGVGNDRKEVSEKTLGVPVFSIGIPTVVDAVTITSDTIDYLLKHFGRELETGDQPSKSLVPAGMSFGEKKQLTDEDLPDEEVRERFLGVVGMLEIEEKRQLIQEVLRPLGHDLMVTPKDVDDVIIHMSKIIASGINQGLHQSITNENASDYIR